MLPFRAHNPGHISDSVSRSPVRHWKACTGWFDGTERDTADSASIRRWPVALLFNLPDTFLSVIAAQFMRSQKQRVGCVVAVFNWDFITRGLVPPSAVRSHVERSEARFPHAVQSLQHSRKVNIQLPCVVCVSVCVAPNAAVIRKFSFN